MTSRVFSGADGVGSTAVTADVSRATDAVTDDTTAATGLYQCVTKQVGNFNNVVPPLFKKPTLDKEELSNYRRISNLSLISKIIESVVKSRITDHLTSNSLTQFSPVSILQISFHRNNSFVHPRSPRQCSRITESIMPLPTRPLCLCFRHYLP